MPELADPDRIPVARVAELLGVKTRSVYGMIDRGELTATVTWPAGPKRRRHIRVTRADVDECIRRAQVKPGELRHLYPG